MKLPTYTGTTTTKTYAVNQVASTSKTTGQVNFYRMSAIMKNRTNIHPTTIQNRNTSGSYPLFNSRRKSEEAYSAPQTVDVNSLNADLAINEPSTTTRQFATNDVLDSGTDPGGDPIDPPIPVGDGFWTLLCMLTVYALWKRKV